MRARVMRSGRPEAVHDLSTAAIGPDGEICAVSGDPDRVFYLRSSLKPVQATISQELGADLGPEQMAVAASSHAGQPIHIAYVQAMLDQAGLDEADLHCPPSWPRLESPRMRLVAGGYRRPRRIWHNCSGKHAAMLRACRAQGWPAEGYWEPDHPLQEVVAAAVADLCGESHGPPGVDGCGVPTFPVTVVGMARLFGRLAVDDRYRPVLGAMHRFPALVGDSETLDARLMTWLPLAAKFGAEACLGVAVPGRMGVAVKCWDGASRGVEVGMMACLDELGVMTDTARRELSDAARQPVLGGGVTVGFVTADEDPSRLDD